jgi:peptidoglycan-N-acetylglucosamine deacetylase
MYRVVQIAEEVNRSTTMQWIPRTVSVQFVLRLCSATLMVFSLQTLLLPVALADEFIELRVSSNPLPGAVFGSHATLDDCWSLEQLGGKSPNPTRILLSAHNRSSPPRLIPLSNPGPLPPDRQGSIRSVEVPADKGKPVALTLDLCETAGQISGYDADLVNILRSAKARATFFAGGKWMLSHPELAMQLMADPLFEIGNHSWSHARFSKLNEEQMEREILWAQAQYEVLWEELQTRKRGLETGHHEMEKIPRIPKLFRFPYGTCSPAALHVVNQHGMAAIQWSVVTGDAAPTQTDDGIVRIVQQQVKPGAIIIAHANGRGHGIVRALQRLIPDLRQKGYEFVTVSQLLDLGKVATTESCYEIKPNDNRHYDSRRSRRIQ